MGNYSILLVDDEEIILKTIGLDLKESGYDLSMAESGEEAINLLKNNSYDLVITDLLMKGVTGIGVLEEVKKTNPETRVMIFTSQKDLKPALEAFRLDVDDYMMKTCTTEELLFRVKHCLEKLELRKQMEKRSDDLQSAIYKLESEIEKRKRVEKQLLISREKLLEKNEELKNLSILDGLTEIYNRRYFHEYFDGEWKRVVRDKKSISLIMIDIDFFKLYNDTYGHLAGDTCLKRVAKSIYNLLHRPADLFARYGGEEFVAVLPGTEEKGAIKLAEQMRVIVEDLKIQHSASTVNDFVTISLGVASISPDSETSTDDLIDFADKVLYKAKHAGRNQVINVCY